MMVNRRDMLLSAFAFAAILAPGPVRVQQRSDFDPVTFAKLRAGEIAREITASQRDPSVAEPPWEATFNDGLLLQAGLRALLPVKEREGVALPGTPSPKDPQELIEAQENYKAVFELGAEATPAQKEIAVKAIERAAHHLDRAGYKSFSKSVTDWLGANGYVR
jgi:hypothetical protein